jgi:hypothetical protein
MIDIMMTIVIDIMMKDMTMTTTMMMIIMVMMMIMIDMMMEPTYQPTCGGILMVFNAFHLDNEVSVVAYDPPIFHLHRVELGQVVVGEHSDTGIRYLVSMLDEHEVILREASYLLPIRVSGLDQVPSMNAPMLVQHAIPRSDSHRDGRSQLLYHRCQALQDMFQL